MLKNKTKQNKTKTKNKQNKTKQKTKQNKTKQNTNKQTKNTQILIFHENAPDSTYSQKSQFSNYKWKEIDQLLLPYDFLRDM